MKIVLAGMIKGGVFDGELKQWKRIYDRRGLCPTIISSTRACSNSIKVYELDKQYFELEKLSESIEQSAFRE